MASTQPLVYTDYPVPRVTFPQEVEESLSKRRYENSLNLFKDYIKKSNIHKIKLGADPTERLAQLALKVFPDDTAKAKEYARKLYQDWEGKFAQTRQANTEKLKAIQDRIVHPELVAAVERGEELSKPQLQLQALLNKYPQSQFEVLDKKFRSGQPLEPEAQKMLDEISNYYDAQDPGFSRGTMGEKLGEMWDKTTLSRAPAFLLDLATSGGRGIEGLAEGYLEGIESKLPRSEITEIPELSLEVGRDSEVYGQPEKIRVLKEKGLPKRIFGYPAGDFAGELVNPSNAWSGVKEFFGAALEGEGRYRERPFDAEKQEPLNLKERLLKTGQFYADQAAKAAIRDLPEGSDEEVKALARDYYDRLLKEDMAGSLISSPEATDLIVRSLGDVAIGGNIFSVPAKGISAAYKGAKAVPKVGQGIKAIERLGQDTFSYMPEASRLADQVGGEAGKRILEGLRAGADKGVVSASEMSDIGHKMDELLKFAKTPEDKKFLFDLLEGRVEAKIPEGSGLAKVVEEVDSLRDRLWDISERTGIVKRIEHGEDIVQAPKEANYVERKITKDRLDPKTGKLKNDVEDFRLSDRPYWTAKEQSYAFDRKMVHNPNIVPDARMQFAEGTSRKIHRAQAAESAKYQLETLLDEGVAKFEDFGKEGVKEALEKQFPNVDYVKISPKNVRELPYNNKSVAGFLNTIYKSPGEKAQDLVLPREALAMFVAANPVLTPQGLTGAGKDIIRNWVRPVMNIWRINKTVLSGSMQYLWMNIAGSASINAMGLGKNIANPAIHHAAGKMAFAAAFGGHKKALKGVFSLPSGEAVSYQKLFDIMRDFRVLGQHMAKSGLDLRSSIGAENFLIKADKAFRKLGEKTRAFAINGVYDEFTHASTFLGALKSTSKADINAAVEFAAKASGAYHRLSKVEKTYFREFIPFYAWQKFIVPAVARTIKDNPHRIALIERLYQQRAKEYAGDKQPVPDEFRPRFHKRGLASKYDVKEGERGSVSWLPETPLGMMSIASDENLLRSLGPLQKLVLAQVINGGVDPITGKQYAGTAIKSAELKTHLKNRHGASKLDQMFLLGDAFTEAKKSNPFLDTAVDFIPGSEFGGNVYQYFSLLWNSGRPGLQDRASDLALRYAIGRRFAPIERLAAPAVKKVFPQFEPVLRGGPGHYYYDPASEMSKRTREAKEKSRVLDYQLSR